MPSPAQRLSICRSCDACRAHKVRCSKEDPQCMRCQDLNIDCHYTNRRPRTTKQKDTSLDPKYLSLINGILERLDRLEVVNSSSNASPTRSLAEHSNGSQRHTASHVSSSISDIPGLEIDAEMSEDGVEVAYPSSTDPRMHENILEPKLHGIVSRATDLAVELFQKSPSFSEIDQSTTVALNDLRRALKDMHNDSLAILPLSVVEYDLHLPPQLVNGWIAYTAKHLRTEFFLSLVDWDLISAIPNLIHSPHLTINPSILLVYYVVLWCGWLGSGISPAEASFGEKLYGRCLTLWRNYEPNIENQTLRLVGAAWMTWIAIDNLDFGNGWEFHSEACRVAQDLGLHQLDNHLPSENHDESDIEVKRQGFWQLLHADYGFRLGFGTPILISEFRVNLPSLKTTSSVETPENSVEGSMRNSMGSTTFVVTSRIAFIITKFFGIVDMSPSQEVSTLDDKIENLCDEIESILVEWNIEMILQSHDHESTTVWMLTDILIHGWATIILIQTQWYGDRANSSTMERSIRASRKLVRAYTMLADANAVVGSISFNFAGAHPLIAIFTLYSFLLENHDLDFKVRDKEACRMDLVTIERMCTTLKRISKLKGSATGPRIAANNLLAALGHLITAGLVRLSG